MPNLDGLYHGDELAIIGIAGRFPQAGNTERFWQNLREGVESIISMSEQELVAVGVDPALLQNPQYVKARAILDDVEWFDASFFDITPREAELLDPQHRLFLECAWEALEQAGYATDAPNYQIGVFASTSMSGYLLNLYSSPEVAEAAGDFQIVLANDKDYLPTRVSYKLNLRGPSLGIQTACSSSLVAVHLACQSVLNGECDIALAGGVSISLPQRRGYLYRSGGIASPDGHCRAFDAQAQGTVGGSGVGVVVLKRLVDALADGDAIHAIIKGSAINNDGSAKTGYTAPSVQGQMQAIAGALTMARVAPETIGYIEAHGTGTVLGDPIEVAALTQVFRAKTRKTQFCALSSVKTNIGHLDAAAGIAGLIKTVLALKHRAIPPSLHFHEPNPEIDFAHSPFYVSTHLTDWPPGPTPRRAGVSSFGIGGTNAHVILEEAPEVEASDPTRPWQLLVLSAKTSAALETSTDQLLATLKCEPALPFADVAYTLQIGRQAFDYRRVLVCHSREDAVQALEGRDPRRLLTSVQEQRQRPVAFLLPGLGDHYVHMAADLYRSEPSFRAHVDQCCTLLDPYLGCDLRSVLYPDTPDAAEPDLFVPAHGPALDLRAMLAAEQRAPDDAARRLNQTALSQPAVFVISYALAQLWQERGVGPQALLGYSLGEYVAACLAGVLSLEDALKLVARRAQLIQALPEGAMLAVSLPEQEVRPLLNAQVALAAINGPAMCVLAGSPAAIAAIEAQLRERDVVVRRLQTTHAFHSPQMHPIAEAFAAQVRQVALRPPAIPYISNVTGTWITIAQATDPDYWVRHLGQTVLFADGLETLLSDPEWVLLEVGPGQSLSSLALQRSANTPDQAPVAIASLRHAYDRRSDEAVLLNSVGQLWLAGVAIDWAGMYRHERRQRLHLPTYPFERQRYWVEPGQPIERFQATFAAARRRPEVADWFYLPSWKPSVRPVGTLEVAPQADAPHWLVFVDACGVGAQIVEQLRLAGHSVTTVVAGQRFDQRPDGGYLIDPRERSDYLKLVTALRESQQQPRLIAHMWGLAPDDTPAAHSERFELAQYSGFYSLLFLAQALTPSDESAPLDVWVVANGMHVLAEGDVCFPEKATVLGPCKTIPQEYPQMTFRMIDVVLPDAGTWQASRMIDQLMAEFKSPTDDRLIAYRGYARWVQTFEPLRLASAASPRLREKGVYLITGGLGRDSLVRAAYLARSYQARLALIGRAGLPDRATWEQWLATHPEQDAMSMRIRQVQELEALGAEVLVIAADVSDVEQMYAALRQVDERFGALHGVIHAAGITDAASARPIAELGPTECELHFRPKVYGVYVLDQVLEGRDLDFCLLTSSITAIVGGLGLCAYSAASVFMDAFVHKHNQTSPMPWTSLNWEGAPPDATVDAFVRLLALRPTTQVVVSVEDLDTRIARRIKLDFLRGDAPTAHAGNARPRLRIPYAAPTNPVEQRMAEIFQTILGIAQVGIHDSFFELGGDSLLGMQVIAHLHKAFQIDLPLRALFDIPTAASLAVEVVQRQAELTDSAKLEQMLEELENLSDDDLEMLLAADEHGSREDSTHE
jgi:acyl transferase domain-containing protein/acyl carrier protein